MSKYLRQPGNPHAADARHILELLVDKQFFYPASDDGTPAERFDQCVASIG